MSRRLLPLLAAAVVAAVGLSGLTYGIILATTLRPPTQTIGRVPGAGVPVVDTATGVLDLDGSQVEVSATAASGGPVFIGVARADDVTAYLAEVSRCEITRVTDDGELTTVRAGTQASLPDPSEVDIWAVSSSGTGTTSLVWPDAAGTWRVVVAGDGTTDAPQQISLAWSRAHRTNAAPAVITVGVLLLAGGLVGLLVLRGRGRDGDGGADGVPTRTVLSLVLSLMLVGCGGSGGGTSAVPDPVGPHPVVRGLQAKGILDRVSGAAAASASSGTADRIGERLVGPEKDLLTASLKLPANLRPVGPATDLTWRRLLVPTQSGWPRWFVAVGQSTSRTTPVVWVLWSQDARRPYGLWGELLMLPAAELPEVARADRGAPEVSDDGTGLVVSPKDVAVRYADVLSAGPGSRHGQTFAADVFREQVLRKTAGDRVQLLKLKGTVTSQHAVRGTPMALRTADGGALVIAELTETYTVKVPANAGSVTVGDPQVAALAGRASFTRQVVQTSTELVAFAVPSTSAGGQVRVIAATKAHLSATGS